MPDTDEKWVLIGDGIIRGPHGGTITGAMKARLRDLRPLWKALAALALAPESYQKPNRITGGDPMPGGHGIDPGYLHRGKHARGNQAEPQISLTSTKRKWRFRSNRPYLPDVTDATIEKVERAITAYVNDGDLPGAKHDA